MDPTTALVYASGDGHVYYRFYDISNWSSATNLSSIVPGTAVHQTPSLSGEIGNLQVLHVAWHRKEGDGVGALKNKIIYRKSTTHNSWPSQYTEIYYEEYRPSITAFASNNVDIIFENSTLKRVYKHHYNGSSWTLPIYIADGQYPSVSVGGMYSSHSNAKYVWTSAGSTPFTVNLSSETLSKEGSGEPYYKRAISWLDSSGAHVTVRVKGINVKISTGEWYSLALQPVSLDTVADFNPANAFEYLVSAPAPLSADAESLVVDVTLWAENLEKVGAASNGGVAKVNLELKNAAEQRLTSLAGPSLPAAGMITETSHRFAIGLNAIKPILGAGLLKAIVTVEGLTPKPGTFASLGHIYDFTKSAGKSLLAQQSTEQKDRRSSHRFDLLQSYPNPFNPSTQVRFAMKEAGIATLRVYNLNGQVIRELLNEYHVAGEHRVLWDGRDDRGRAAASGVYFIRFEAGKEVKVNKVMLVR
ncbi:MAG: T9SS type A sorting domain-containing protein [bacterium]